MASPTRPALRYHGGKWRIAPWIIEHLPAHICYVEPFGGGGSVLLRKPRSKIEVYNDLDQEVVGFFRVLRERGEDLAEAILLTPYSRAEFDLSYEPSDDPLEAARRLYVRSWQAFGSSGCRPGTTGWRYDRSARRGRTLTGDWCKVGHLEAIVDRLRGVHLECSPALEVLSRFDAPTTAFYVDPPYLPETRSNRWGRGYRHELTAEEHEQLAEVLHGLEGAVLLSGYDSPMYCRLYSDWTRYERQERQINAQATTEVLWVSPGAEARQGRLW